MRPGGAWHHLSPRGGPREEITAAIDLLEGAEPSVPPEQHHLYDELLDELEDLDDGADLPHAFVHPDFVPANAITTPDDHRVIVDWAGAGRGPRAWSLAFLLYAEGAKDLRRVDVVLAGYRRHVTLEDEELDRLAAIAAARPLVLSVWSVCTGRSTPTEALAHAAETKTLAEAIAARARAALER